MSWGRAQAVQAEVHLEFDTVTTFPVYPPSKRGRQMSRFSQQTGKPRDQEQQADWLQSPAASITALPVLRWL